MIEKSAEVVICGAGIAGVAAAYYLTQAGVNNVILIDKQEPLSLTTAKSGENYRNWWPNEPMAAFCNRSIELMEELAAATNNSFLMNRSGYVYATMSRSPAEVVAQVERVYGALPVGEIRVHERIGSYKGEVPQAADPHYNGADILTDPALIRRTLPHLSDQVTAVVHARRGGSISVHQLGMYLLQAAKAAGVQAWRGELLDVESDGWAVSAVVVQVGEQRYRIHTNYFVNAAGPFLSHVAQMVNIELPVQTVFQQKIAMQDPLGVIPRTAPFTIFTDSQMVDWSAEERQQLTEDEAFAWLLQRLPGGLHIKPEGRGDSKWLKLGWAINDEGTTPQWSPEGTEEFPDLVLRGASKLVPALSHYIGKIPTPLIHYGGYYTKTAENMPLIGPVSEIEGVYLLGALSGFGTMSACAAGELCATWLTNGRLPTYAWAFAPDRYQDAAYRTFLDTLANDGEL